MQAQLVRLVVRVIVVVAVEAHQQPLQGHQAQADFNLLLLVLQLIMRVVVVVVLTGFFQLAALVVVVRAVEQQVQY
jgi:hypothetical protein